jgi:hypothetical protein
MRLLEIANKPDDIARVCALIPPPRFHMIRSGWRARCPRQPERMEASLLAGVRVGRRGRPPGRPQSRRGRRSCRVPWRWPPSRRRYACRSTARRPSVRCSPSEPHDTRGRGCFNLEWVRGRHHDLPLLPRCDALGEDRQQARRHRAGTRQLGSRSPSAPAAEASPNWPARTRLCGVTDPTPTRP